MIQVPKQFQPRQVKEYPQGNVRPFEEWFFDRYEPQPGRRYLPVFWTSYYCQNGYGKSMPPLNSLQNFLKDLKGEKLFTIVQYDDGILNDVSGLDIKVFAMSGPRIDYPLPLICWPHKGFRGVKRDVFCSFVGRDTHWIRRAILSNRNLYGNGFYVNTGSHKKRQFVDVLNRSVFTLCPRGYGQTSFRIAEALESGSIPVYISDKFIEPHNVPFDDYGVTLTPDQIKDIRKILESIPESEIRRKQAAIPGVFREYYSYEANRELIYWTI